MDGLNVKQATFAKEYMVDLNGKQAAIRAGYAQGCAEVTAAKLLRHAKVKAAIDKLMDKRSSDTGITAEYVLRGIKELADCADKQNDKLKALELLGKHLKLFTEKVEHTGEGGGPVRIVWDE